MTEQEEIKKAIKMLKDWNKDLSLMEDEKEGIECHELAIKALEKQIPKKPTFDGDGYAPDGSFAWDEWLCTNCGSRYEVDFDDYDYCPNCGQRIDWSDKE